VLQGVDNAEYVGARTSDGAVWVAYVDTKLDRTTRYEQVCDGGSCECIAVVDNERSTYELRVFRVILDGSPPMLVAALPIAEPYYYGGEYSPGAFRRPNRLLDARAYGMDVAVGIRTKHGDGAVLRVLRIDGTKIGAAALP
jgi:hypothetical protein